MHKLSKAEVMREVKDYIYITLGLISYSLGWAAFLLPYQITTGGTTGDTTGGSTTNDGNTTGTDANQ